jgi:CRP-like cAMP-binding protein
LTGDSDRLACSEVLAGCQAFSRLPLSVRDLLSAFMFRQPFQTGEVLMRQGEQGTNLMVIGGGSAQVVLRLPDGSVRRLEIVSRGDIVGEMALLTRDPRNADVVALEAGEAFVLSADLFEVLTSRHPDISVVLTDLLTERLGRQQIDALGQKVLHGYRVEECIGRGGMATVYRAVHEESGERVALKMMHHRLVYDPDALARFQREADIAESLAHKNIVAVYGRFSDYKTYFMVMEFCDGPTLGRVIREWGGLEEDAVRAVIGQLAQALTYLHDRDLAHRDLKPSNVLLTREGRVKLADFGLARPVYARKLTLRGVAVGTPAYMAPEQIAGRSVDSSVDIYALGCLAYELLTGAGWRRLQAGRSRSTRTSSAPASRDRRARPKACSPRAIGRTASLEKNELLRFARRFVVDAQLRVVDPASESTPGVIQPAPLHLVHADIQIDPTQELHHATAAYVVHDELRAAGSAQIEAHNRRRVEWVRHR